MSGARSAPEAPGVIDTLRALYFGHGSGADERPW